MALDRERIFGGNRSFGRDGVAQSSAHTLAALCLANQTRAIDLGHTAIPSPRSARGRNGES